MFSLMRGALGGWIAKIFLALLVISFAVWGISGSMFSGVGNSVITAGSTNVGLQEYQLAYERQLGIISRQLGQRVTTEQARAFGVEQTVTAQLISGAVMDEEARKMGLGISDDRLAGLIGDDEAFKDGSGQFSRAQLEAVLRSIGMPQEIYIKSRKDNAIRQQIMDAATLNAAMPDAFNNLIGKYQAEKRSFKVVDVTPEAIADKPEPAEEDLSAWYEAHKSDYIAPEFRKLLVVKMEAEDITDEAAVTSEEIEARYEEEKAKFGTPEKRQVQQIVFPDKAAAEAAAETLSSGTTFEDFLAETDRKLADIDLGLVTRSEIPDPNIAEAAFSLEENASSGVVEGIFGPVLLHVSAIEPASTKPLVEVSGELRKQIALDNAEEELFDAHDKLEDERAAGETLSDAAKIVGLATRTIDAIDRTGRDPSGNIVKDIPEAEKLLAEVFETDEGVETDPMNIGSSGFVWYEVVEITPERQKELAEITEQVKSDWIAAETQKAVNELAEAMRERVAKGETLAEIAADVLPENSLGQKVEPETVGPVQRTASTPSMTPEALRNGFTLAKGSAYVAPSVKENARTVVVVSEVDDSGSEKPGEDVISGFGGALADDLVTIMVTEMQRDLKVTLNQPAIDAVLASRR